MTNDITRYEVNEHGEISLSYGRYVRYEDYEDYEDRVQWLLEKVERLETRLRDCYDDYTLEYEFWGM
jgi:hypothetical protein